MARGVDSSPSPSSREVRARNKRWDANSTRHRTGKHKVLKFLFKSPTTIGMFLFLTTVFVLYIISSIDAQLSAIIEQYVSLTAKQTDSKYSFDKRLFYVTVDSDGTKTITFGYKSEVQQEQAEEAIKEASGSTDSTGSIVNDVVSTGPTTDVASAKISTDGQVIKNIKIGGIPVYDGIPSSWNASSNSKYIDFVETVKSWKQWYKQSFGRDYPNQVLMSGYHSDNQINRWSTVGQNNNNFVFDEVKCMGFAPSGYYATLTFRQSDGSQLSSVYNYRYCIVLRNNNDGTYVFMPAVATDAKAHTWPGDLCQTYMKYRLDTNENKYYYYYCESGEDANKTTSVETALSVLETGKAAASYNLNDLSQAVQMNIEVYQISEDLKKSGYTAVGFVRVE